MPCPGNCLGEVPFTAMHRYIKALLITASNMKLVDAKIDLDRSLVP